MSVITNDIFQKNKGMICFRYIKENNRICNEGGIGILWVSCRLRDNLY